MFRAVLNFLKSKVVMILEIKSHLWEKDKTVKNSFIIIHITIKSLKVFKKQWIKYVTYHTRGGVGVRKVWRIIWTARFALRERRHFWSLRFEIKTFFLKPQSAKYISYTCDISKKFTLFKKLCLILWYVFITHIKKIFLS